MFNLSHFLSQIGQAFGSFSHNGHQSDLENMSPFNFPPRDDEEQKRRLLMASQSHGGEAPAPDNPPIPSYPQLPDRPTDQPIMPSGWRSLNGSGTGIYPSETPDTQPVDMTHAASSPDLSQPAKLTGSRKILADIEATKEAPSGREHSFWHRLGSGAIKGMKEWQAQGQPGGVAGLVGAALTGTAIGGGSPKALGEWSKNQKVRSLEGKYAEEAALEGEERKRTQDIAKTDKGVYEAHQAAAKPYMDAAMKKGYFTDDEVKHIQQFYGIDITNPNNPEFVEKQVNGQWQIRYKNDPRYTPNPTIPPELTEQPYDTEVPGQPGVTVPARPGQVLSTAVGVAQANAGRQERAQVRTEKSAEDAEKLTRDNATKRSTANAAVAKAQKELQGLKTTKADLESQGFSTDQIDTKIAAVNGELAGAQSTIADLDKQDKANKSTKTKTSSTFTEAEARDYYRKQGKTDAEINSLIQKGKARGLIK